MEFDDRKLVRTVSKSDVTKWITFCPACQCCHVMRDGTWTFNGDYEKPTFGGSLAVTSEKPYCHSTITDGLIFYHGDSKHQYAGKSVPMEPF